MLSCAFCERPLICDACQTPFQPASSEQYEALSRLETAVLCTECEQVLVCHWCKTPYDGAGDEDAPAMSN